MLISSQSVENNAKFYKKHLWKVLFLAHFFTMQQNTWSQREIRFCRLAESRRIKELLLCRTNVYFHDFLMRVLFVHGHLTERLCIQIFQNNMIDELTEFLVLARHWWILYEHRIYRIRPLTNHVTNISYWVPTYGGFRSDCS